MLGRKKSRSFRPGRREALVGAVLVVVVLLERLRGRRASPSDKLPHGEERGDDETRESAAAPPRDYAPPED